MGKVNDKRAGLFSRLAVRAGNFSFVFTGSITVDEARRLSALYLASLPTGESPAQ
jgi:hypothetical protein